MIAQEVEKVFPEVVDTGKDGFKSVNYPALVAPLIEAVKTLYNRITGVESNVQALKAKDAIKDEEIEKLKQENAAIKSYLYAIDPKAAICK